MPSPAQIEFFRKLSEERDFSQTPAKDAQPAELQRMFSAVNDKSASVWIEKAMSLPKMDTSDLPTEAPPF